MKQGFGTLSQPPTRPPAAARSLRELGVSRNTKNRRLGGDAGSGGQGPFLFLFVSLFPCCLCPHLLISAYPALQQHYMVLQSLALDEATPGEIDDLTLPDLGYMKGSGLGKMFGELRRAVYPDGYCAQAMIGAPLKRPAITAGPGSPKAPRIDVSAYDFDALVRDHKLNKLTVPELKQHLSDLGLSRIGVKAALIAR
eukprot:Hpha_TRINITY_DN15637_c0_g1::TRINITY_DN15637_c0_g1_i1::g.98488::m.98488